MIKTKIICPKCGKISTFSFGDGKIVDIGERISEDDKTDFDIHVVYCPDCDKSIYVYVLIKNGRFFNILTGLGFSEKLKLENEDYPKLYNYPDYSYEIRKNMFLGEESRLIPSQYFSKKMFRFGDDIELFDKTWCVLATYKLLNTTGDLFARIYKVRTFHESKTIERLLILRDNYIPTLKQVNWSEEKYKDGDDQLKRYRIPEGYELIMSSF